MTVAESRIGSGNVKHVKSELFGTEKMPNWPRRSKLPGLTLGRTSVIRFNSLTLKQRST
jgi:hypothetical protein